MTVREEKSILSCRLSHCAWFIYCIRALCVRTSLFLSWLFSSLAEKERAIFARNVRDSPRRWATCFSSDSGAGIYIYHGYSDESLETFKLFLQLLRKELCKVVCCLISEMPKLKLDQVQRLSERVNNACNVLLGSQMTQHGIVIINNIHIIT